MSPETGVLLFIKLLGLLVLANGAPILVARLLGRRYSWPIDGGHVLQDGRRMLGASKTWRGMVAAVSVTALASALFGLGAWQGAVFGALAMCGDLLSSFTKRRLGLESSAKARGIDQIPESLLPLMGGMVVWGYDWWWVAAGALVFYLFEVFISPLLFSIGLRRRPY